MKFAQERFHRGLAALIDCDANHRQSLIAIIARQVDQSGGLLPARSAPTCPIIDEHHLAAMVGKTPGRAVQLRKRQIRHRGSILNGPDASLLIAPTLPSEGDPQDGDTEEQILDKLSPSCFVLEHLSSL